MAGAGEAGGRRRPFALGRDEHRAGADRGRAKRPRYGGLSRGRGYHRPRPGKPGTQGTAGTAGTSRKTAAFQSCCLCCPCSLLRPWFPLFLVPSPTDFSTTVSHEALPLAPRPLGVPAAHRGRRRGARRGLPLPGARSAEPDAGVAAGDPRSSPGRPRRATGRRRGSPPSGSARMVLPAAFRLSGAAPAAVLAAGVLLRLRAGAPHRPAARLLPAARAPELPPPRRSRAPAARPWRPSPRAGSGRWLAGVWHPVAGAAGRRRPVYFLLWIGLEVGGPQDPPARGARCSFGQLLIPLSRRRGGLDRRRGPPPRGRPAPAGPSPPSSPPASRARRRDHPSRPAPREGPEPRPRPRDPAAGQPADDHPARRDGLDRGPHPHRVRAGRVPPSSGSSSRRWPRAASSRAGGGGPAPRPWKRASPSPTATRRPCPGFHRRTPWQILERLLRSRPDGTVLGRIRLWCDPRRIDSRQIELLDRLLPQMTASIQRCLLDREAREDPLTGVAMRRVLEKRLHEAHAALLRDRAAR